MEKYGQTETGSMIPTDIIITMNCPGRRRVPVAIRSNPVCTCPQLPATLTRDCPASVTTDDDTEAPPTRQTEAGGFLSLFSKSCN